MLGQMMKVSDETSLCQSNKIRDCGTRRHFSQAQEFESSRQEA
jgi:hypothetical protein